MENKQEILNRLLSLDSEALSYMFPGSFEGFPEDSDELIPPCCSCECPSEQAEPSEDGGFPVFRSLLSKGSIAMADYAMEYEPSEDYPEEESRRDDERARRILEAIGKIQKEYGVTIDELEMILSYRVKLSHLVISHRGKLTLTDFDFQEVKMDLLSKAVFLLFLKHPEGIEFKSMPSYRKELRDIYYQITNRDNDSAIEHSLDLLCNPVESNSLNEKVSRIKRAFTNVMDERIARAYYIEGPAGGIRKIALDRDLVIWE